MNIASVLEKTAAALPGKAGYVADGTAVTYGELHAMVSKFAAGLAAAGLARGDRAAIWHHSSIEFVALTLAVLRLGAIVVPVNVMLKEREASWVLSNAGASWLFHGPDLCGLAAALAPNVKSLTRVIAVGGPDHRALFGTAELPAAVGATRGTPRRSFTSGTRAAEGAEITRNLDANTAQLIGRLATTSGWSRPRPRFSTRWGSPSTSSRAPGSAR